MEKKNKFIDVFNLLKLYLFIFVFIFVFLIFVYIRFLRPRLPKEIPYSLTEFSFYLLTFICIFYFYIVYKQIYPKTPPQYVLQIISKITYPFIFLQNKIIFHPNFYPNYTKFLYNYILIKFYKFSPKTYSIIFFSFKFLIKSLLLVIFLCDIILFQKIEFFYYFLILNIIPVFYSYSISHLKYNKEILILQLEAKYKLVFLEEEDNHIPNYIWEDIIDAFGREKYEKLSFQEKAKILIYDENDYNDPDPDVYRKEIIKHNPNAVYHKKEVKIREYIDIMYERMLNWCNETDPENNYDYTPYPTCHDHIYKEYEKKYNIVDLRSKDYVILDKDFHFITKILLKILYVSHTFHVLENKYKYLNISLDVCTMICWFFILSVSVFVFPSTFEFTLIFLNNVLENLIHEEPFSFCNINSIQNIYGTADENNK